MAGSGGSGGTLATSGSGGGGQGGTSGAGQSGSAGTGGSAGGNAATATPSAGCAAAKPRPQGGTVTVSGKHYFTFPESYDGTKPLPVLVGFHGCGDVNRGTDLESTYLSGTVSVWYLSRRTEICASRECRPVRAFFAPTSGSSVSRYALSTSCRRTG